MRAPARRCDAARRRLALGGAAPANTRVHVHRRGPAVAVAVGGAARGLRHGARRVARHPRKLPVASRRTSGAVVAVWVTNDRKVADWVSKTLFRAWGVRHAGTWRPGCASDGSPVLPVDEHAERKPWEPSSSASSTPAAPSRRRLAPRGARWLRRAPVRRAAARARAAFGASRARRGARALLRAARRRPGASALRARRVRGPVAGDRALPPAATRPCRVCLGVSLNRATPRRRRRSDLNPRSAGNGSGPALRKSRVTLLRCR